MRYDIKKGATKYKNTYWLAFPIFGIVIGLYFFVNLLSPATSVFTAVDATAKKLVKTQPIIGDDRLYIPKINVDVAVVPVGDNEELSLEKGAINRAPASGNPKDGGNFVLAAHRFNLGLTPSQTRARSPFYNLDKVQAGDDVYLDYQGVRYAYQVAQTRNVSPNATEIEDRTQEDQLTLYTCELSGPDAGREVVVAQPQGTIVWNGGTPQLKTL